MKCSSHLIAVMLAAASACGCLTSMAQEIYPLSLAEKITGADRIVIGRIETQLPYVGAGNHVYTLHKVQVTAFNKGVVPQSLFVITLGGTLQNQGTLVQPAPHLEKDSEYLFFLQPQPNQENKVLRSLAPQVPQFGIYAFAQGALVNNNNSYVDYFQQPVTEAALLSTTERLLGTAWKTPGGLQFKARLPMPVTRTAAITSFTPATTRAGTLNTADRLTINGSGFGATPGTVAFANADNGGANFVAPPQASDYVSWSDNQIVVKVPTNAGTGSFVVNGSQFSPTPLTVSYALLNIYGTFLNFPVSTRKLPRLVNKNNLGGYTFLYNSTSGLSANAPARAAIERALVSWRGGTGVNFRTGVTTTLGKANDATNVILFGSLPAGTLGEATLSFLNAGIAGTCDQENTVTYIDDIDLVFSNPPTGTTTWQYGPAAPTGSQFDFETVALHEFGHAHNLGHVIAPGQVMHYAIANGQSSRVLNGNDIAGGNAMMAWSSSFCVAPPGVFGPMTPASAVLPVRLQYFTGSKLNKATNRLEWRTAEEQNNKGFYLQRSIDGLDFYNVAFIPAVGSSAGFYQYQDANLANRSWYYRLRQEDFDGKATYSAVLLLKGADPAMELLVDKGAVQVRINTAAENRTIFLYGPDGKLLWQQKLRPGTTRIPVPAAPLQAVFYRIGSGTEWVSGRFLAQ